jgi:tetratricopeptide (TPR) repeat protein
METSLPFGLIEQAIDGLGGQDVLEVTVAGAAADVRAARFFRVLRWIQSITTQPTLILIDDLHWADADSIALLSFLCRRIDQMPLAVIASVRPWPPAARDAAVTLVHSRHAAIEELLPLSEGGAAALLTELVGESVPETKIHRAVATCAGNPLLLEQVATTIARGEDPPVPGEPGTGRVLTELLLARFATLPESTIRYAQAASVFGIRFQPDVVGEVAEMSQAEADEGLEVLWSSGLLKDAGGRRVEFIHALFAQALYQDLSPPVRGRLHRRACAALMERDQEAEAAEHAMHASASGDNEARVLERAGRAALEAGALAGAARQLQAAVEIAGRRAAPDLLSALGEAQFAIGRVQEAAGTYEHLLANPSISAPLRIKALRTRGRALHLLGEDPAAADSWREVVQTADEVDPAVGVEALLDLALASMFNTGPAIALAFANRAMDLADRADERTRLLAQGALGLIAQQAGEPDGVDRAAAAAKGFDSGNEPLVWWEPRMTYALAATWGERFAEAEEALNAGLSVAERAAAVAKLGALIDTRIYMLWRRGHLVEARALCDGAATLADLTPLSRTYLAMTQGLVSQYMGRVAEVDACVRKLEPVAASVWAISVALGHLRGLRHLHDGDVGQAFEVYAQVDRAVRDAGVGDPCWPVPWARHAALAYLAAGRAEDATRLIGWLEGSEPLSCRWPQIAAASARALQAEQIGDLEGAERHFQRALEFHGQVDLPLEMVETLLEYGTFLRRASRLRSARPILAEALRVAQGCGADWLAATASRELGLAVSAITQNRPRPIGLKPAT